MKPTLLPGGWVALPDREDATAATGLSSSPPAAKHPSGAPWIFSGTVRVASAGPVRLAVIGACLVDDAELERGAVRALRADSADALMSWPGSYHLLVSWPDRQAVYGDVAGLRRLYVSEVAGVSVVSSHARAVAEITKATLDETGVASLLLLPAPPQALQATRTPWAGVRAVPPASRVTITVRTARTESYWQLPEANRDLAAGAEALAQALETAVAGRTSGSRATVQLSGGMDSTALAAMAHAAQPETRMVTVTSTGPANEDQTWARRVTHHLEAHHELLDDLPDFYAGIGDAFPSGLDAPDAAAGAARLQRLAAVLGSGVHLNGQGGDEVLEPPLGATVRDLGVRDLRQLRGHAALHGTTTPRLLRHAYAPASLDQWMRRAANRLRDGGATVRDLTDWEVQPQLGPWATRHAEDLITEVLRGAASRAAPARRRWHTLLARIRTSADGARLHGDTLAAHAARLEFPFLDRAVIEACLSVRPSVRSNPWEFKPLLSSALRPWLPGELRTRTTKDAYDEDLVRCWTRHRDAVLPDLLNGRLIERGLLDRDALIATVPRWPENGLSGAFIDRALGVEYWLRSVEGV